MYIYIHTHYVFRQLFFYPQTLLIYFIPFTITVCNVHIICKIAPFSSQVIL